MNGYGDVVKIALPSSDAALLAECEVHTFRARGKGGQHLNKTESAIRLVHRPSGIAVSCQRERSQHRNKAICLTRLRERIAQLNYRPPPRVATRVPARTKRERLESKLRLGRKKKTRGGVRLDAD